MQTTGLSLDQAPPIGVPFGFFITGLVWALVAGLLLLFTTGQGLLQSRWNPEVVALTHLFTVGFLLTTMMGALFQVLPVVAGTPVKAVRFWSKLILFLQSFGTAGFIYALATGGIAHSSLFVSSLIAGVFIFIGLLFSSMYKKSIKPPAAKGIKLAILGLLITVILGGTLVALLRGMGLGQADYMSPTVLRITPVLADLHLLQGLLGWAFLLIVSVSYQVIPMFFVTSPFPAYFTKYFGGGVFVFILINMFCAVGASQFNLPILGLARYLTTLPLALYAVFLLLLVGRRKRKVPDVSLLFWKMSAWLTLAAVFLWVALSLPYQSIFGAWAIPELITKRLEVVLGVLFVAAISGVILGMQQKIIPFLIWFHLQSQLMKSVKVAKSSNSKVLISIPTMKEIVSDGASKRVFYLYVVTLVIIIWGILVDDSSFGGTNLVIKIAALLLLVLFSLQLWNCVGGLLIYQRIGRRISKNINAPERL